MKNPNIIKNVIIDKNMIVIGKSKTKKFKRIAICLIYVIFFMLIGSAVDAFCKTELKDDSMGIPWLIGCGILASISLILAIAYSFQPTNTMFYDKFNQRILLYYGKFGFFNKKKFYVFYINKIDKIFVVGNRKNISEPAYNTPELHLIKENDEHYISTDMVGNEKRINESLYKIPGLHIIKENSEHYVSTDNDDYYAIYENIMSLLPKDIKEKVIKINKVEETIF